MDIQNFLESGIVEKYVLGLATPEEMDHVERMTKEYPEVNAHICKMQNCMEEYAEMHAVRPPKHLKERILASLPDDDVTALLSTQVKHIQTDQKVLQTSTENVMQRYSVLKDVTTRQVHLKGSQNAPQALAVVYWNPDHSTGYLNIVDLPKCPAGHAYQMWADVNGEHMDMGMLKADDSGAILLKVPYIKDSRGFVITLEKEGGSPHPTVEKMFAHGEM